MPTSEWFIRPNAGHSRQYLSLVNKTIVPQAGRDVLRCHAVHHCFKTPISLSALWFWFFWPFSVWCRWICKWQHWWRNSVCWPLCSLARSVIRFSGMPRSSESSRKLSPALDLEDEGYTVVSELSIGILPVRNTRNTFFHF